MTRMDWVKARRDGERARQTRESIEQRRSGQRTQIKTGASPATPKQRAYIAALQLRTGTHEPVPPTAWQASNLIDHLRKILVQQSKGPSTKP